MKIDITALREAANKFATTLDAHRANPRDALAVTEWDEATSALTDIVGGDENNIIVALFDMLEAERQQREAAEKELRIRSHQLVKADALVEDLEAELAALRGEQEPVGYTSESALSDVCCDETAMFGPPNVVGDIPLFTRQPKPVVPTAEMIAKAWRECLGKCDHATITRMYAVMQEEATNPDIKCYSCKRDITFEQHANADGFCPHCGVEIEIDEHDELSATSNSGGIVVKDGE